MSANPLVEIRGVSKSFPGVKALDDVSVDFHAGEVHALIGENGAGKSTLIKIVSGVYTRDCGTIRVKGEPVSFRDTRQALNHGISVIHQELNLVPDMTVAENLFLGQEPCTGRLGFIDKKRMRRMAGEILGPLGVEIHPDTTVRDLSTAGRQMVEIARAVSQRAILVIMDEPTSSLSEREVESLFRIILRLKKENVGVVFVSHRLREVREVSDRVTVLRDGSLVKTLPTQQATEDYLVSLMVGREINDYFARTPAMLGEAVLEVKDLCRPPCYSHVSFELRRGEILGIAGLVGAGRTELLRGLFGVDPIASGTVRLLGRPVKFASPAEAIRCGLGLVPEDRRLQGLLLDKAVKENISLPSLRTRARRGFVDRHWERQVAAEYIDKLRIRTPSAEQITKDLSGGNQQKVVIAKWLAAASKILLLDEPTRGIDVNAKAEIYALMNAFAREGGSIIMASSELPEILGIADRIVVMSEGRVTGVLQSEAATEEAIMHLASLSGSSREVA